MSTAEETSGPLPGEFPPHSYDKWREAVDKALKGAAFDQAMCTKTPEGVDLGPIFRREDIEGLPQIVSFPGFSPFLRGSRASGYVAQGWEVAQELRLSTVEELNHSLVDATERGQTAISFALDLAGRAGLDRTDGGPEDVGVGGVSISSMAELDRALGGLDLRRLPVHVDSGASACACTAMIAALLEGRGIPVSELAGSTTLDPLAMALEESAPLVSLAGAYREMACLGRWATRSAPHFRSIAVRADPFFRAGGSAVHEVAFAAAAGLDTIRKMDESGLDASQVARQIRFSFVVGSRLFMEIAKLRAARLVWAKILSELGVEGSDQAAFLHVRTSGQAVEGGDPCESLLRATTEALSGVLGGCDSMHVELPSGGTEQQNELLQRIARNTQLILAQEVHLTSVIDPIGGSWFVEWLTQALAERSWELFQKVEGMGGMAVSLTRGFPQEEMETTAARWGRRSAGLRRATSAPIASLAESDGSLDVAMEALIEAAEHGATLGRLTRMLRGEGRLGCV